MLRPGHVIALCVLALLTVGVVMVTSAGMSIRPVDAAPVTPADAGPVEALRGVVLSRPAAYMGLAMLALLLAARAPVGLLARLCHPGGGAPGDPGSRPVRAYALLGVGVAGMLAVLALVYLPGLGREVNGSSRWISVPPGSESGLSIQPSEIAKWGLVACLAAYAALMGPGMRRFWTGLVPGLAAAGLVAGLVLIEDLGTGVLIGSVACLVLLAGGARFWHFLLFVPAGIAAVVYAIATSDYRVARLTAFLDPYQDPQGTGYHMIQSMTAVAGGEFFGRGLGHGLQKFGYLPEDKTDFLFAVICEELGVFGAAVVVSLFLGLIWAGAAVIRRQDSAVLKLAGLGVVGTVGAQALINLAVVTGLGPTKGIALPLVSAGGTGWILTAASLGLLVAMDRRASTDCEAASPPLPAGAPALPAA